MTAKAVRMPALFLGHGNPMTTLSDNRYTRCWRQLGLTLPRPKAILAISAHWMTNGLAVTAMNEPRTIHDFGGFPQELFDVRYAAPGDPVLAADVQRLLAPMPVVADHSWGLDHGVWSVLRHLCPEADVPVVQLSLDHQLSAAAHYELGKRLMPLRDQGILILASGNVVHNLRAARWDDPAVAYGWASSFEEAVRQHVLRREDAPLIDYVHLDVEARLAVPTTEHYLPLLPFLGVRHDEDEISIPVTGIEMGSLSMLSVVFGIGDIPTAGD